MELFFGIIILAVFSIVKNVMKTNAQNAKGDQPAQQQSSARPTPAYVPPSMNSRNVSYGKQAFDPYFSEDRLPEENTQISAADARHEAYCSVQTHSDSGVAREEAQAIRQARTNELARKQAEAARKRQQSGSFPPSEEGSWRGSLPPSEEGAWRGSLSGIPDSIRNDLTDSMRSGLTDSMRSDLTDSMRSDLTVSLLDHKGSYPKQPEAASRANSAAAAQDLYTLLQRKDTLAQGILLREILGKPKALRAK